MLKKYKFREMIFMTNRGGVLGFDCMNIDPDKKLKLTNDELREVIDNNSIRLVYFEGSNKMICSEDGEFAGTGIHELAQAIEEKLWKFLKDKKEEIVSQKHESEWLDNIYKSDEMEAIANKIIDKISEINPSAVGGLNTSSDLVMDNSAVQLLDILNRDKKMLIK